MSQNIVVYDLTVSKIWCTMCANKIKSSFEGKPGTIFLQSRDPVCPGQRDGRTRDHLLRHQPHVLSPYSPSTLQQIREIFESNNFFIVGSPRQVNADSNKERKARFFFPLSDYEPQEILNVAQNLNEEFKGSIYDIKFEDFIYHEEVSCPSCSREANSS